MITEQLLLLLRVFFLTKSVLDILMSHCLYFHHTNQAMAKLFSQISINKENSL